MADNKADPITIKKYANRRLYNTSTSKYVTLDDLALMVKGGTEFVVIDAKSGDEITRSVLTQIIFEEEAKGQNLLPISFLRQLIQFYGDSLQSMVPNYLEAAMHAFTNNQEQMREQMQGAMGGMFPFARWEELGKQNMAMFESALQMFSPFAREGQEGERPGSERAAGERAAGGAGGSGGDEKLESLKSQIEALRRQIDEISRKQ